MSTYGSHIRLAKPAKGDTNWDAELNLNWDAIDRILAPGSVYEVSPYYSAANLGNGSAVDRRHFDTIQGAITASEAAGFGADGALILVHPASYAESLAITKSVAICSTQPLGRYYPGGSAPLIRGDGTASPVVSINPVDGTPVRVAFGSIRMENRYNTANATEITSPYFVDADEPTTYGSDVNTLSFEGCQFRGQTWGADNKWTRGIRAKGWWSVKFHNSQASSERHGGGNGNGLIRRLFELEGGGESAKTCSLFLHDSKVNQHFPNGLVAPTDGTPCYLNSYSQLHVHRASLGGHHDSWVLTRVGSYVIAGGASGASVYGLASDTEVSDLLNFVGEGMVVW